MVAGGSMPGIYRYPKIWLPDYYTEIQLILVIHGRYVL